MENKSQRSPKPTVAVADPDFEKAVNGYIDMLIAREKDEQNKAIEPFDVRASKMRSNLEEGLHTFQHTYAHGYQVLIEELKKSRGEEGLEPFFIQGDCRQVLQNTDDFSNFLAEGIPLYQLFGFSVDALSGFYDAAGHLLQEKRFEDAKDAFFFLTMIAPHLSPCWLGLGYCYLQCREYDAALRACAHTLDLNPDNPDHYLIFSRVFLEMKDFNKALDVCELGLIRANENRTEEWAEELAQTMEEAKHQIQNIKQKSSR